MPVLSATDVRKTFPQGRETVEVLRGISLALAPGEIASLEGPSGSGKTTLLSILGCVLTATGGEIVIADQRVDARDQARLTRIRKQCIGFVFQNFNLFESLTARENVEYALNVKGFAGLEARQESEKMIESVGLGDRRDFLPRDLSAGQKQRVAIARALVGGVPVILADEPTANLDSQAAGQILELFRGLVKESRRALLVVTHDPKVRAIADRVLQIRDGLILKN